MDTAQINRALEISASFPFAILRNSFTPLSKPPASSSRERSLVSTEAKVEYADPLVDSAWQSECAASPDATFFHTSHWMSSLRDAYGYRPLLARLVENEQTILSLPLMEVESRLTGKRGIALPFTDRCGPIGAQASAFPSLVASLLKTGAERSWKYLELRGGTELIENAPPSTRFWRHLRTLSLPEETLFASFSSSTRRAIRKAERSDLRISDSLSIEALETFYALMQQSRKRHGLPPQPFRFFESLYRNALTQGKGRLLIAFSNETPIAGALFLHHNQNVLYKFGASDKRYQELRANNQIMWQAIRRYALEGYETLDFGRTSIGNEGLRRFKLGWGTAESTDSYLRYDFSKDRWIVSQDQSNGWSNRFFRLLPIPILRALGSLIYKHVA